MFLASITEAGNIFFLKMSLIFIFFKIPVPSTPVTIDYCMATNSGEDTLAVLKHLTMQTNRMMNYQNSLALHKILPMMITNKLLKIKGVLCVQVKIEVCHNYKP